MSITTDARDAVIRTIVGEADRNMPESWAAIAHVIKNRIDSGRWGPDTSVRSVVFAPKQFSTWNPGIDNPSGKAISPNSPEYQRIAQVVDGVFNNQIADPTGGATHYYSPSGMRLYGKNAPDWAANGTNVRKVGSQIFMNMPGDKMAGAPTQPPVTQTVGNPEGAGLPQPGPQGPGGTPIGYAPAAPAAPTPPAPQPQADLPAPNATAAVGQSQSLPGGDPMAKASSHPLVSDATIAANHMTPAQVAELQSARAQAQRIQGAALGAPNVQQWGNNVPRDSLTLAQQGRGALPPTQAASPAPAAATAPTMLAHVQGALASKALPKGKATASAAATPPAQPPSPTQGVPLPPDRPDIAAPAAPAAPQPGMPWPGTPAAAAIPGPPQAPLQATMRATAGLNPETGTPPALPADPQAALQARMRTTAGLDPTTGAPMAPTPAQAAPTLSPAMGMPWPGTPAAAAIPQDQHAVLQGSMRAATGLDPVTGAPPRIPTFAERDTASMAPSPAEQGLARGVLAPMGAAFKPGFNQAAEPLRPGGLVRAAPPPAAQQSFLQRLFSNVGAMGDVTTGN